MSLGTRLAGECELGGMLVLVAAQADEKTQLRNPVSFAKLPYVCLRLAIAASGVEVAIAEQLC